MGILDAFYRWNEWSDGWMYGMIFFGIVSLSSIVSYFVQQKLEKPCKSWLAFAVRIFHHFIFYYIQFSLFAPAATLWMMILIVLSAVLSWIALRNNCFLTQWENILCFRSTNHIFRDLSYAISPSMDLKLRSIRIPVYATVFVLLLLRYYVYYKGHSSVEVQGHRGCRGDQPQNTIAAFKYALDHGVNVLEMDVQLTKDKQLVVYHDRSIDKRICEGGQTGVAIKTLTVAELKRYDCGTKVHPEFQEQQSVPHEKIPLLSEVMALSKRYFWRPQIKLSIELKTEDGVDTMEEISESVAVFSRLVKEYGLEKRVIFQSSDKRALEEMHRQSHWIPTAYLVEGALDSHRIVEETKRLNARYFSPDAALLTTKELVDEFHKQGIQVVPWTVNDTAGWKRCISLGVDALITDYPLRLLEYLSVGREVF